VSVGAVGAVGVVAAAVAVVVFRRCPWVWGFGCVGVGGGGPRPYGGVGLRSSPSKVRAIKTIKITPEGEITIFFRNHRGLRLFFIGPISQHKHQQY
jgi:hypothetical protein